MLPDTIINTITNAMCTGIGAGFGSYFGSMMARQTESKLNKINELVQNKGEKK